MSDADAFQVAVADGDGEFCPKSVWKKERASAYRTERGDNCLRKLVGSTITPVETLHRNLQFKRAKRK
jgi:hypothetical protein